MRFDEDFSKLLWKKHDIVMSGCPGRAGVIRAPGHCEIQWCLAARDQPGGKWLRRESGFRLPETGLRLCEGRGRPEGK